MHARGLVELSRLEWRIGDPGDPADLVQGVAAGHGLPAADLSAAAGPARPPGIAGAAVHLSAAACAKLAGAPLGRPSPAPAVPDVVVVVYADRGTAGAAGGDGGWWVGEPVPSWTRAEHAGAVRAVRDAIAAGDVYQVNVVGHSSMAYRGDPRPALYRVAGLAGARYPAVLHGQGWALGCASPETLVRVSGGHIATRPIKGTAPATIEGREVLRASAKERAEHVMIVDLARNDLARVAVTGSVRVDELYAVRRWSGLWQAESVVSAEVAPGTGLATVLRALCPGGSVTGAPKLAAVGLIATLEPVGRGPAMGALGWLGPDGLDLGLTIRTVAADAERLHVWAGGGITWGSDPDAEVAEAAAKAAPLLDALTGPA